MECFTIMHNEIEGRIDPFYYRPEFRELEEKLSKLKHKRLEEVIEFSSETWNQKDFFDSEFPYIEISEIDTSTGEIKNIIYYEKSKAPSRAKMIVRENDIIVSTTRPHRGAISLIDKKKHGFIASTGFAILRGLKLSEIKREYLLFFLRTRLALKQMLRRSSGGNYPAITSEELKKLIIPIPPLETQQKIINKIKQAYNLKKQKETEAQQLLDSINDYILSELGIKLPELKDQMTFIVYADDVKGKRIDAYYYQPKFEEIEKAIKRGKYKLVKIKDVLEINNKLEDIRKYEQIQYVDLASIDKDLGIIKEYKIINSFDAPSRARQKVNKGDLLLACLSGSLKSIAIVNKGDKNIIASTGFYIIKNTDNYNNYYLWALFRNKIYQILLNRETTGAIMSAINRDSLLNLKIPLPPLEIQNKIAEEVKRRIQKAEELQKEAKEVLEKAKQEVEKMILEG